MGALFYSYGNGGIFKNSVGSTTSPAVIDIFADLASKDNLCVITQIGVTLSDTVQFFLTFDDLIHYYWFGKGVGNITCQGLLFLNCDSGDMPGVEALLTAVGEKRGQEVQCSFNAFAFTGVLLDCNITMISEPETMASFTANFAMIDHTLQPPKPKQPAC